MGFPQWDLERFHPQFHHWSRMSSRIRDPGRSNSLFDVSEAPAFDLPMSSVGQIFSLPQTCEVVIGAKLRMSFQRIDPGSFVMGARGYDHTEAPEHPVTIARPFYLGITPVTQEQFAPCFPEHRNHFFGEAELPAENLTWHEAMAYCAWLQSTFADQIPVGYMAALPDEARWEYACRAGSRTEYANGDGPAALDLMGWFDQNSGKRTHPVARKQPNAWGLYDCHGNVNEWMSDLWNPDAYRDDPLQGTSAAAAGEDPLRVVRGGSWYFVAWDCRSARRGRDGPGGRIPFRGFRVCLVPGPDRQETDRNRPGGLAATPQAGGTRPEEGLPDRRDDS
jgi:formylglycine-generating enzyme required for sulfatase activity